MATWFHNGLELINVYSNWQTFPAIARIIRGDLFVGNKPCARGNIEILLVKVHCVGFPLSVSLVLIGLLVRDCNTYMKT